MSLAREARRLPVLAVSLGFEVWERTRGPREFALRRGAEILQIAAHTPLGRFLPQQTLDDGAEAEAERIVTEVREAAVAQISTAVAERAREQTAQQPASASAAAAEVGAPGAAAPVADKVTEQLKIEEPTSRDELPIPDFDNITLGSLRARLRSLSVEDLVTLREWEQAHAHRLPVVTLLDNRIAKLAAEANPAYPTDPQTAS